MALKLAALKFLSRSYPYLPKSKLEELLYTEDDMKWAIEKTERHLQYFIDMLKEWKEMPNPAQPKTLEDQVERVISELKDKEEGIAWSQLRGKIRWESVNWVEVIKYLWDTELVSFMEATGGKGRKGLLLVYKPYEMRAEALGYKRITSWGYLASKLTHLGLKP
jgi:hypothetical protein